MLSNLQKFEIGNKLVVCQDLFVNAIRSGDELKAIVFSKEINKYQNILLDDQREIIEHWKRTRNYSLT